MKPLLTALLTLAVTAALVVYAFWEVDIAQLLALLAEGSYWVLLPFEALLAVYLACTALRWQLILRPLGRYGIGQVVPAMMIGFGGNNLLPAHLGELVRAVVFASRFGCSRSAVLTTLVVERGFDVFAILVTYLLAVAAIEAVPDAISGGLWGSAAVLALLALAILAFLRFPAAFVALWQGMSRSLPVRLRELGLRTLRGAEAGVSGLRSPVTVGGMIAYSLVKWLASGAMIWLSLWGYGVAIDPPLTLVVVAVTAVAVTIPSVPGFFGVMQAAFVFALTPFGVTQEVALAASVFFLVAQWVPVTLAGVSFFIGGGLRLGQVRREVAQGS